MLPAHGQGRRKIDLTNKHLANLHGRSSAENTKGKIKETVKIFQIYACI
jgi:hypothetical protein